MPTPSQLLAEPAIREKMEQIGVAVVGSTQAELARHLRAETELWGPVIKAANIRSE
jgi:tripartite-type tricarboxylate transporter receptor subunit TctC